MPDLGSLLARACWRACAWVGAILGPAVFTGGLLDGLELIADVTKPYGLSFHLKNRVLEVGIHGVVVSGSGS